MSSSSSLTITQVAWLQIGQLFIRVSSSLSAISSQIGGLYCVGHVFQFTWYFITLECPCSVKLYFSCSVVRIMGKLQKWSKRITKLQKWERVIKACKFATNVSQKCKIATESVFLLTPVCFSISQGYYQHFTLFPPLNSPTLWKWPNLQSRN